MTNNLKAILEKNKSLLHPMFEPDLTPANTCMLDLSAANPEITNLDFRNVQELNNYVFGKIASKVYGYGGYMEDREVYRRSPVFDVSPGESRSIHLGIDVWTQARKPVMAPLDATIHSFQDNNSYGDYGPTIILQHQLEETTFYTLYGHLTADSLDGLFEGKKIEKGMEFCRVGNFPDNGDWPPHLHFQVIADMKGRKGDYFGVSSKAEQEIYREICPDPVVFFCL